MLKKVAIYLSVGCVWGMLQLFFAQRQDWCSQVVQIWLIGFLCLMLARCIDNYCDYDKDCRTKKRKPQYSKRQLLAMSLIFSGLIIVLSFATYGNIGCFCGLLSVGILIICQRINLVKIFTLALISMLYLLCLSNGDFMAVAKIPILIYIGIEIGGSVVFMIYKTKKLRHK